MPVRVTDAEHVVVEAPDAGVRETGFAAVVVGGSIFTLALTYAWFVSESCRQGSTECDSYKDTAPYWLAATGVGVAMTTVGIVIFASNDKPSIEVQPVLGHRARQARGTFVGLRPVEGSTLPALSLRTSF
jgi:hypothetical protein